VDRTDIDGDGSFVKTVIGEAPKKEWEKPSDVDEVVITATLSLVDQDPALSNQVEEVKALIVREQWVTNLGDEMLPFTVKKVLETMKRGEKC
jgi:hypothetical protein